MPGATKQALSSALQMPSYYFRIASDCSDDACQLMAGNAERAAPEVELLRLTDVDVDEPVAVDDRSGDRAVKLHGRASSAGELVLPAQGTRQLPIAAFDLRQ